MTGLAVGCFPHLTIEASSQSTSTASDAQILRIDGRGGLVLRKRYQSLTRGISPGR